MATNLLKFPLDLDGGGGQGSKSPEHHHMMVFRIYSNSSASIKTSNREDLTNSLNEDNALGQSTPENLLLGKLDNSRGQNPDYKGTANTDGWSENPEASLNAIFSESTSSRAVKVNQDAIYLPFPQTISMMDGWNWETVSFQKTALGEAIKGDFDGMLSKFSESTFGAFSGIAVDNGGRALMHNKRKANNPRKESLFSEPEMRSFSFEFDFAPRNKEESDAAQQIIQLFKYHASPELSESNNALYRYPSEFQIYFVSNGTENQYIGKIDRCALKSISVNYTGANIWSAFKGTGAPTTLKISLEFTELSLQSRNNLMRIDEAMTNEVQNLKEPTFENIAQSNGWDGTSHLNYTDEELNEYHRQNPDMLNSWTGN